MFLVAWNNSLCCCTVWACITEHSPVWSALKTWKIIVNPPSVTMAESINVMYDDIFSSFCKNNGLSNKRDMKQLAPVGAFHGNLPQVTKSLPR
jgi:hypothetical protein